MSVPNHTQLKFTEKQTMTKAEEMRQIAKTFHDRQNMVAKCFDIIRECAEDGKTSCVFYIDNKDNVRYIFRKLTTEGFNVYYQLVCLNDPLCNEYEVRVEW